MADQTRSIELPSRGLLYGGKVPDGKVTIRKLRVDELSLFESQGDANDRIETLIQSCVKFPDGFEAKDLLATDRFAILIALRQFTYPVKYPVNFNCKSCGEFNTVKIDLVTELTVKMAETDGPNALREPVEIKLPDSGATLTFRFARASDQEATVKYAKRLKQQNPNSMVDPTRKHLLARQLLTVDGAAVKAVLDAERYIGGLPAYDIMTITKVLEDAESGVDTDLFSDCKSCGFANKFGLPFNGEFFRPADL